MPRYQVMLEGNGAIVEFDGKDTPCGFYTTRVVSAPSEEIAVQRAIELARQDLSRVAKQPATSVVPASIRRLGLLSFARDRTGFTFFLGE